jgi:hypothetical protein
MGQRLLEQREAVDIYLVKYKKRHLELKPEEWFLLEKVVKVLEPLEAASKQMCRDDEPISIQYPVARALTRVVHDIRDPELREMRNSILGLLVEKFDIEEEK